MMSFGEFLLSSMSGPETSRIFNDTVLNSSDRNQFLNLYSCRLFVVNLA